MAHSSIEQDVVAGGTTALRAEFVNPFLQAANEVLQSQIGENPRCGSLDADRAAYISHDVTALIGVA